MPKASWLDTTKEDRQQWESLCPPANEYRIIDPSSVQSIIPRALVEKAASVLLVASGSPSGTIVYMANINRVDCKARAIDQEPFAIAFHGNSPAANGVLLHHGNWEGRTIEPPKEFWTEVESSDLFKYFPFDTLPSTSSGRIQQLTHSSHEEAFKRLIAELRNTTELP